MFVGVRVLYMAGFVGIVLQVEHGVQARLGIIRAEQFRAFFVQDQFDIATNRGGIGVA